MRALFIPAGRIHWASSRFRAWWPAEHLPEATVIPFDEATGNPPEWADPYDVIILQKHGLAEHQQVWREQGKRVIWDACDPMWWFSPDGVRRILEHVDLVTVSTPALAADFRSWYGRRLPVAVIPDRLKLEHYPLQRLHRDATPIRLIWFGMGINRYALAGAWANLCRLAANGFPVELTIFDDAHKQPMPGFGPELPVYTIEWRLETENMIIAAHDIALLPPYPGPWGPLKSNNKQLTATACGLPVTTGHEYAELLRLVRSQEAREREVEAGLPKLTERYDVRQTAQEWRALFTGDHV